MSISRHTLPFPTVRILLFAVVGACLGCISSAQGRALAREDQRPAPSSSLTKLEALAIGELWKKSNPEMRGYCVVAPTGSMAPILDSRSVLLLERAGADDLRKNDISVYLASAVRSICHRVVDVQPDGVLFDGDNNRRSDGWVNPEHIRWRVAAIIFTRRDPITGPVGTPHPGRPAINIADAATPAPAARSSGDLFPSAVR